MKKLSLAIYLLFIWFALGEPAFAAPPGAASFQNNPPPNPITASGSSVSSSDVLRSRNAQSNPSPSSVTALPGMVDNAIGVIMNLVKTGIQAVAAISFMLGALRLAYFVMLPAGPQVGISAVRYLIMHFFVIGGIFFIIYNLPSWLASIAGIQGEPSAAATAGAMRTNFGDLGGFNILYELIASVILVIVYIIIFRESVQMAISLLGNRLTLPDYEQSYIEFAKRMLGLVILFFIVFRIMPEIIGYIRGLQIA